MSNPYRTLSNIEGSGQRQDSPTGNVSSSRISRYCRNIAVTTLVLNTTICCIAAASMVMTALFVGESVWTFIVIALVSGVISIILGTALVIGSKFAWWGSLALLSATSVVFFWTGLEVKHQGGMPSWPAFTISAAYLPSMIACLTQLIAVRKMPQRQPVLAKLDDGSTEEDGCH